MALQTHFHPDQAQTAPSRNQALADLTQLGGHCHLLDVRSAKRIDTAQSHGWEITIEDGQPPVGG